jgi:cytochrome c biogenesis protein CcmG, thiol:disulfide interchange protein DsbE
VLVALGLALATTLVILGTGVVSRAPQFVGNPAPAIASTTLDGAAFNLASLRGRPVIVNFWGPSCVPCRDEFPLFKAKLAAHAADGLAIVGVLTYDGPDDAKAFIARYGATWPTVLDADGAIRTAYRVAARPQSYFIDRSGALRKIQVGQVTDADFEADYALIAGAG